MMTSVIPCRLRSRRFHSRSGLPATGSRGFGRVSVSGRSRVPSPAARTIAFMLPHLRHVAGERFSERVEVTVVLQVPSHVAQGPWDVLKIAIVALLQGDIDEPPGGLQVALDAGQVEESQERQDRKSTRLNSSHVAISYAVFCLKKKKKKKKRKSITKDEPQLIRHNHTAMTI